ncbi:MAG: hypothetical protein ACRD2D_00505, partial [Terriglobales bacterium]
FMAEVGSGATAQSVSGSLQWTGAGPQPMQVSLQVPGAGESAAIRRLRLGPLLAATPLRGLLRGELQGGVSLHWLDTKNPEIAGAGNFSITQGVLRTAAGPRSFDSVQGQIRMDRGRLDLDNLIWRQGGRVYRGQGSVDVNVPDGRFQLDLHDGTEQMRLSGHLQS